MTYKDNNVTPIGRDLRTTRAEQIVDYFPHGLVALGTLSYRAAELAEEFADLGIPAYDLTLPSNHPVFREPIK